MRIHWGSGRFCFCFFPKIFLTLKVLLDGYVEKETRIRRQSSLWLKITLSDRATELLGSCTDADPRTCTPYTDDIHRTRRHKPHERALTQTHVRVSTARAAASRVAPPASTLAKTPARARRDRPSSFAGDAVVAAVVVVRRHRGFEAKRPSSMGFSALVRRASRSRFGSSSSSTHHFVPRFASQREGFRGVAGVPLFLSSYSFLKPL